MNNYIKQIHGLAIKSYNIDQVSPRSIYELIQKKVPDGFITIELNGKILGYIIMLGFNQEDYKKHKENTSFTEEDIDYNSICPIKDSYGIYLFSIIVDQDSLDKKILFKLIKEFKNRCIKNCLAITYSVKGENLCRILKFTQLGGSSSGKIFELIIKSINC